MDTNRIWHSLSLELKSKDTRLAKIINQVGTVTLETESDAFKSLVEILLSQQIAPAAARAIIARFKDLSPPFPRPDRVLRFRASQFRKAGVSSQKIDYLKDLSRHWVDSKWRRGWNRLSDEALTERLTEVKGIGEWSAQMYLIFSLGRPNVLPVRDYGIQRGIKLLYDFKALPHPKEIPQIVSHWEGAYSVGCWYLWRALDQKILSDVKNP